MNYGDYRTSIPPGWARATCSVGSNFNNSYVSTDRDNMQHIVKEMASGIYTDKRLEKFMENINSALEVPAK